MPRRNVGIGAIKNKKLAQVNCSKVEKWSQNIKCTHYRPS